MPQWVLSQAYLAPQYPQVQLADPAARRLLLERYANDAVAAAAIASPEDAALLAQRYQLELAGQPSEGPELPVHEPQAQQRPGNRQGGYKPGGYKFNTVFVGGLRTVTNEDRIQSYFARFGRVDGVDIKRLPDGTSRGFAFVKFAEAEAVDKVIEARDNHTIDNKWVDVKRHDRIAAGKWKMDSVSYDARKTNASELESCRIDAEQNIAPQAAARQAITSAAAAVGLPVERYIEYAQRVATESDASNAKQSTKIKSILSHYSRPGPY